MDEETLAILADFEQFSAYDAVARAAVLERALWLVTAQPDEAAALLAGLQRFDKQTLGDAEELLAAAAAHLTQARRKLRENFSPHWLHAGVPMLSAELYRQ